MGLGTLTLTPNATAFPSLDPALIMPLTTVFTPPCYHYVRANDGLRCGPPEMKSVWGSLGYYSPGVCPAGYVAGCTRAPPGLDDFHPFAIGDNETAVSCVPDGFTCLEDKPTNNAYSVDPYGAITYAPAFEIRYKDEDLKKFSVLSNLLLSSTTSTEPHLTATPPALAASPATPTTSPTDNVTAHQPSGLSTGGIVGISIGAMAGTLLLLAAMFYVRHRARESRRQHLMEPSPPTSPGRSHTDNGGGPAELWGYHKNRSTTNLPIGELPGTGGGDGGQTAPDSSAVSSAPANLRRSLSWVAGDNPEARAGLAMTTQGFVAELPGCQPHSA